MRCRECKHFKNFNYTYGCAKFKKAITDPNIYKECFEGYGSNFMNFFDDILEGKKGSTNYGY